MKTFKEYIVTESLEDEIASVVVDKIGDKISDNLEDELIQTLKDRITKKMKAELDDSSENGEEDPEEVEDTGEEDPEEVEDTGEEDPEEVEEEEPEIELEKEDEFVRSIAKDNLLEIEEVLKLWNKAKKDSKYKPDANPYWNDCDKIFKKMMKDEYDIDL